MVAQELWPGQARLRLLAKYIPQLSWLIERAWIEDPEMVEPLARALAELAIERHELRVSAIALSRRFVPKCGRGFAGDSC
jgi:hypothetical protein